jgi:geranylgeranyl diphosphate synthase type II
MKTSIIAAEEYQESASIQLELKILILNSISSSGVQIKDMIDYHLLEMGSCQRALLCIETGLLLGIKRDEALRLGGIVETLHNASLIHDDIQDQDSTRRKALSLWFKYGSELALCAGDSLILGACQGAAELDRHSCNNISLPAIRCAQQTIRGQSADVSSSKTISADEYRKIAIDKAAPLIQLALILPCLYSGKTRYMDKLKIAAQNFALAYQLYDDILDVESDALNLQPNAVSLSMYDHRHTLIDDSLEHAKGLIIQEIYTLLDQADFDLSMIKESVVQPLKCVIHKLRQRLASL